MSAHRTAGPADAGDVPRLTTTRLESPPARVFLTRHGSARMPDELGRVWNYSDAPLTRAGQEEARLLGEVLADLQVDVIVASDLPRTRQTAEAIARATGAPVVVDPRLREIDIGEHEGASIESIREQHPEFVPWLEIAFGGRLPTKTFRIPSSMRFPRGESVADMFVRVLPAFLDLVAERQGQTSVVVSHGWVVKALLCHVTGADVDSFDRFATPQASLTLVEAGPDGRGVLHVLNGTRDLGAAAGGRLGVGQDRSPPAASARDTRDSRDRAESCRVILVRHGNSMDVTGGEPVHSHGPASLTDCGREQARELARTLEDVHIDAIYTSDLARARQTAALLADGRGIEEVVEPALKEISLGSFEGMTFDRVRSEHPDWAPWLEVPFAGKFPTTEYHHRADKCFPDGESVLMVYRRALDAFLGIIGSNLGRTIAIASHAWVIQPLLCHVVGSDPRQYFRFGARYASLTLAEVDADGRGVLHVFNGAIPLEEVAGGRLRTRSQHPVTAAEARGPAGHRAADTIRASPQPERSP